MNSSAKIMVLELFAGTASFSTVAMKRGHDIFTSDIDPSFETTYTVDIMDFDIAKLPAKPDVIWASPPCETFSVASIGHHWNKDQTPKTQAAEEGKARVLKTIEIINHRHPRNRHLQGSKQDSTRPLRRNHQIN